MKKLCLYVSIILIAAIPLTYYGLDEYAESKINAAIAEKVNSFTDIEYEIKRLGWCNFELKVFWMEGTRRIVEDRYQYYWSPFSGVTYVET